MTLVSEPCVDATCGGWVPKDPAHKLSRGIEDYVKDTDFIRRRGRDEVEDEVDCEVVHEVVHQVGYGWRMQRRKQ